MFRLLTLGKLALVALVIWLSPWQPVSAATFTVNSTADAPDANAGDGICVAMAGDCTLQAAIEEANAFPGTDTITFDIPGGGPHTIHPATGLPTISDPVIIDGYTQPGASPNTNGPGLGLNTVLKIELDGTNVGAGVNGLRISAGSSTVRGLVINRVSCLGSCAPGKGIRLDTNGGNVIEGNFIGTDITGTADLGNDSAGVYILSANNNTIGGAVPEARNIISGNNTQQVHIWSGATGNLVQGNFIGTDVTGTVALGDGFSPAVYIGFSPNNIIGGTTPEVRNVISGNNNATGVYIEGNSATGNWVQGNFIGTDVTGTAALGNNGGLRITNGAVNNTIGGTIAGAGNTIAYNDDDGVQVSSFGPGNAILSNSIFSNTGLGIDLDPNGVNPNDAGDPDTGPNNRQNFPMLTMAGSDQGMTDVEGTIDSTPNNEFRLEFFSNLACDPSNHGEAENLIGSTDVITGGSGNTSFVATFFETVPSGSFITATATDLGGNTSEFSQCIEVVSSCGNGVVDAGEECDDGNNDDGDGCAADCTIEEPDIPATTAIGTILLVLALGGGTAYFMRRETTT